MAFLHGVEVVELDGGPRPISGVASSVIGLVGTAKQGLTNVPTLFLIQPNGKIQVSAVGFERKALETAAAAFGQIAGQPITVFQPTDTVPEYKPG